MAPLAFVILSFIMALGIALYAVPGVVGMSHTLKLFDQPNERSSAKKAVPTLGGIAIFLAFVFAVTLGVLQFKFPELIYILTATLLLFFVGLKDDILNLSAYKKLIAQLIAAAILIFLAKIHFTNLHGFLGIHAIGYIEGVLLTAFVIIVFINAFNLIDGIDGLSAGLGIFAAALFGIWFYISGHFEYAVFSFSLMGALCGFFYYNVYGVKNKIFMGDTGSLILGMLMSVIVIKFNEFNIDPNTPFAVASAPAISFAVLIYPLGDTIRVFLIRILQNKSPFSADKNHMHHRLLTLGYSHNESTFKIIAANSIFVMIAFPLQNMGTFWLMIFTVLISAPFFMLPSILIHQRQLIKKGDLHQQLLIPRQMEKRLNHINSTVTKHTVRPGLTRFRKFRAVLERTYFW